MTAFEGYEQGSECPRCGAVLERWPHLDGSGHVLSCSVCHYLVTEAGVQTEEDQRTFPELDRNQPVKHTVHPAPEPEPEPAGEAGDHPTGAFRALVESEKTPTGPLDPEAFEGVPEEVQTLLKKMETGPLAEEPKQEPAPPETTSPSEVTDARPFHPMVDPDTGELSPEDIVRLAADEDVETTQCPHCQATIAVGLARCPWCDNPLDQS